MREQIKDKGRLEHILESIDNIIEFTDGADLTQFISNKMLRFAVIKNLEILGEASYKLTKDFRKKYDDVEWDTIIGLRHVLVHGYYQIRDEIAWKIVQKDLKPLKEKIQTIYNKL